MNDRIFAQRYARVVRLLGADLEPEHALPEEVLLRAESRLGVSMPRALREYYGLMGAEPSLNQTHNRLLQLDELEVVQGHIAFLDENQSVVLWTVRAETTPAGDAAVFQCANAEPLEFSLEHSSCAEFLSVMLVWHACMGALEFNLSAPCTDTLNETLVDWEDVGIVNELEAFVHDEVALCVLPWDDGRRVFMGSRNEGRVTAAASRLGLLAD